MQAIIKEYEFPPIDCLSNDVNFESRYGTYCLSSFFVRLLFSARILITCLKVNKDLFISMLYLAWRPSAPVTLNLSEPARSTSSILLDNILLGLWRYTLSTRIVIIEWLLEDWTFSLCEAWILFLLPRMKYFISYYSHLHSKTNMFSTVNCSSLLQRKRKPSTLLDPTLRLFKDEGFNKSYILSLYIWRKETNTE